MTRLTLNIPELTSKDFDVVYYILRIGCKRYSALCKELEHPHDSREERILAALENFCGIENYREIEE